MFIPEIVILAPGNRFRDGLNILVQEEKTHYFALHCSMHRENEIFAGVDRVLSAIYYSYILCLATPPSVSIIARVGNISYF